MNTGERTESMPSSTRRPRCRDRGRTELVMRERLLERMLQKQTTSTKGDTDRPQTWSRGKKRSVKDEPPSDQSVKHKRVKTTTNTITLDNQVLTDCTVVVKADTIDNLTPDRKVLPIIHTKEEGHPGGRKRKAELNTNTVKCTSTKKLDITPKHGPEPEYARNESLAGKPATSNVNLKDIRVIAGLTKEDNKCYECPKSCACKIGPSPLPRPTIRRGYPQKTPLYKKLLQRRLLNTVNMVFNKCCARQCSQVWCERRYTRARLEAGYDPSDLRVDIYKWGQWKQKPDEKNEADYDWFW